VYGLCRIDTGYNAYSRLTPWLIRVVDGAHTCLAYTSVGMRTWAIITTLYPRGETTMLLPNSERSPVRNPGFEQAGPDFGPTAARD